MTPQNLPDEKHLIWVAPTSHLEKFKENTGFRAVSFLHLKEDLLCLLSYHR